ncbi:telomerase reverse transcriptase isoform X2 [Eucyclogobius newberryi]|uniref:telomerase reverse transcriptase isoform X2 n=1 Tax=Eucyclogobius newberryi TaxID=166745 RepID=UPI003B5B319A
MTSTDFSCVLKILHSLYLKVETLEDFADGIVFKEGQKPRVIEESDTTRFSSFVRGVYVCSDKELQQVPSSTQICTLPELLAFVLNNLKRKRKKNVLIHGYNFLSHNEQQRNADLFKFQGDVTQSAAYIHGSDLWKKITKRLGTDITRYLLENCSLFVVVPPSCFLQVCGLPIYDRISLTSKVTGITLHSQHNARKARKTRKAKFTLKKGDKSKMDCGNQKRKREMNACDDEVGALPPAKRLLLDNQNIAEEQPMLLEPTQCTKSLENRSGPGLKEQGEPSWRSGTYPPLPPSQCFIRTLGFLYGGRGMRGFLLNRKKKAKEEIKRLQGKDLIRIIFFEGVGYLNGVQRKPKKLPQRFFNMVPVFNQLLRRHRRFLYGRILQKLCPSLQQGDPRQGELTSLLSQHCAAHRVYLFVRECLTAVIPPDLWGSDQNRVHILARVRGFLSAGKSDKLSLADLLWKMKVNDCDWIKLSKTGRVPPSELAYRTQILGQFLAWLLDGYVVGLVRACFYVTESVGQKNALRFYRQEVWAQLQDLAFRGHLSKGQMKELTAAQVALLPKSTVISRLRFIPKSEGMRPITRVIGADIKTRLHRGRVRDLLDMLNACVRSSPSLLGSTVWGMTDIHKVMSSLASQQKEKTQPLYFVKVDVSGAYESLPHDKLIEVITQALTPFLDELFTLRRYAKVWSDSHEGLKKAFLRQANLLEDNMGSSNMKSFVSSLQKSGKIRHSILVEQFFCSDLHGKDALQFFTQMLTGSIVQFGQKTYRQYRGIPQGSVVSSLLCCLCYGHMENTLFENNGRSKGRLLRFVDDFLLITPELLEAQAFLKVLLPGVPQYGLVINPQKVAVNFKVSESVAVCPEIRVLPPRCMFPWCGLLLDTHSLDVYKDYSSYAGLSLRYSLTLGSFHSAGQQMKRKLMTNSVEAVYQNIYKLVLLHACRFHVCAQSLPFGQTVAKNPNYFLLMIWDMADYANQIIRKSNKGKTKWQL